MHPETARPVLHQTCTRPQAREGAALVHEKNGIISSGSRTAAQLKQDRAGLYQDVEESSGLIRRSVRLIRQGVAETFPSRKRR